VKWVLAAVVAAVVLGPGLFAMRRQRGGERSRRWLGTGAAVGLAAAWVVAVVLLIRAF
jgi:hypothetical protein